MKKVMTGLQVLIDDPSIIGDRAWALVANHAAVTAELDHARVALAAAARGPLLRLFAPEHGLDAVAQDMEAVGDQMDRLTGAPVRSLYGSDAATLAPRSEDLEDLEVVVVDLPDIGTRYYTYAATMDAIMAGCEEVGIEVFVLDRPNPLGGLLREGGAIRPGCESFVSQVPTPVRHGLTLGELALLLKRERYPDLDMTVLMCEGWSRASWWDRTGLPWVPPSPNMPTLETAAIYPGMCLVEATELSEGRGTTRPFHLVGAPWLEGMQVVQALRGLELPGVAFRPAVFRPMFDKHRDQVCEGVEVHVVDRESMQPLAMGLHVLKALYDADPARFSWREQPYEFISDVPAMDLLTGSARARECIENGQDLEPLLAEWKEEVADFERTLEGILLYHG